jgi:IS30 family transposase
MPKPYKHFTIEERERIAIFNGKGDSVRSIARALNRNPSSISREMRRNAYRLNFRPPNSYFCYTAHARAVERNRYFHSRPRLKKPEIKKFVIENLSLGLSPEQIAGRLPHVIPGASLSYETIYQYIYREDRSLIPLLPRAHRMRRKRHQTRQHRKSHIPQRVPITLRPQVVQSRSQAGHWEADAAVSRQSLFALHVLVERKSRFLKLSLLPQKTAAHFRIATNRRFCKLPRSLRRSITYDNGSENVEHIKVNSTLGTKSFFCLPYHSWEKGSVENTIGLIRRFFPKKTDFATIPYSAIKRVEALLNNRPRKCLGFKTPLPSSISKCNT